MSATASASRFGPGSKVQLVSERDNKSKIVKTFAMQALADLAADDLQLRPQVVNLLENCTQTGSPAMKSRGRKLLELLKHEE